jgi:NADH-quinone oxidoreductase subunit G
VQRFLQAKAAPGFARPSWWVASDLVGAIGGKGGVTLAGDAFAAVAASHPEFAGMTYDGLALSGCPVKSAAARATA